MIKVRDKIVKLFVIILKVYSYRRRTDRKGGFGLPKAFPGDGNRKDNCGESQWKINSDEMLL